MRFFPSLILRLLVLTGLVFLAFALNAGAAEAAKKKSTGNPRYASIVVDAESGQVLSESSADKVLYPASLTKLMTLYMVFDALDSGKWTKETRLYVSARAEAQEPSKINLKRGERIRVEDAIKALVVKSANDVAVVVAENYAGTEYQFAQVMTAKAKKLGMHKTVFKNASGLPDTNQVSTARDMAILGLSLLYMYPDYFSYFKTRSFTYKGVTHHSHNRLMNTYPGMDGFKTGFIRASGFNLVSTAVRDGRRLVGVVFGGQTAVSRNEHMASLLDRGFLAVGKGTYIAVKSPQGQPPIPKAKPNQALMIASYETTLNVAEDQLDPMTNITEQGSMDTASYERATAVPASPVKSEILNAALTVKPTAADNVLRLPHHESWSVQVGAFNSRVKGDYALEQAQKLVPHILNVAEKRNVSAKNNRGQYVFRARFSGLSREQAYQACQKIPDCVVIAPGQ